jgi:hypothetical protein
MTNAVPHAVAFLTADRKKPGRGYVVEVRKDDAAALTMDP